MRIDFNERSIEDYRRYLDVKRLPSYRVRGHSATFPDCYAERVGLKSEVQVEPYEPPEWMFDYQSDITRMAIEKGKFSLFIDCGFGKTNIFLEFARHAAKHLWPRGRTFLIVSPLMVVDQTIAESQRFYDDYEIRQVHANELQDFLHMPDCPIAITNYEAIRQELEPGMLGGLALDESSMLKSHYGKLGTKLVEMGRGLNWKICATGTPAPNDRIEYANHAVFMDAFSSVNSFLATFFVNKGQTSERWIMKPHAVNPFYRALSHWSIFMSNPATYGWTDNSGTIPPIKIHEHHVDLTEEQEREIRRLAGSGYLFNNVKLGGIVGRSQMSQIAKGSYKGKELATNKPDFIRNMIRSWPDESTLVWCKFNAEQDRLAKAMPDAGNISGDTPHEKRMEIIREFKAGRLKTIITKPKILGFGLNLQIATRQIFSACDDSYEEFYQAVKRSNRVGSTKPLNVHIPVCDIERPLMENVLRKARMVQADTEEQERIFREVNR